MGLHGRAIGIGASTDGIEAIKRVLAGLPANLAAPVFVVQHVGRRSSGYLPTILSRAGGLPAIHPAQGELIVPGTVYVAPPDHHMLVRGTRIYLSRGPEESYCRPAIDPLFRSLAIAFGPGAVGVVLTGYLSDGTVGLLAIKDRGGVSIIQDPAQAPAPGMVRSALARVPIDHVSRVEDIAPLLIELVADAPSPSGAAPWLEIEDRIAGSETALGIDQLLVDARRSDKSCTLCGAALYELPEPRVRRFRCRAGHAFLEVGMAETDLPPLQVAR